MGRGTSDARVCGKCGYVFEPLETNCPKCAHLVGAHPDVGDPGHEEASPHQREPTHQRRLLEAGLRRQAALIVISLVLGAIATFPVAVIITLMSEVLGGEYARSLLSLVFVGLALLIYAILYRSFPQPILSYDRPKYAKSDWTKYLLVIGGAFAGICLMAAGAAHNAAVLCLVFVALFWLGLVLLILILIIVHLT